MTLRESDGCRGPLAASSDWAKVVSVVVGFDMQKLGIVLAAIALAGCSSRESHTLAVEGEPEAVARFVDAEEARPGGVAINYREGDRRAEFSLPDADTQTEMERRASAANLTLIESRSFSWSVGGVKGSTETSSYSPPPSGETPAT